MVSGPVIRHLAAILAKTTAYFADQVSDALEPTEQEAVWVELDPDAIYEACGCDCNGCTECWDSGLRVHDCECRDEAE